MHSHATKTPWHIPAWVPVANSFSTSHNHITKWWNTWLWMPTSQSHIPMANKARLYYISPNVMHKSWIAPSIQRNTCESEARIQSLVQKYCKGTQELAAPYNYLNHDQTILPMAPIIQYVVPVFHQFHLKCMRGRYWLPLPTKPNSELAWCLRKMYLHRNDNHTTITTQNSTQ